MSQWMLPKPALWDSDLRACYEIGFLSYPTWSAVGEENSLERRLWKMGWDDARDLADCEHFDHSRQKTAMGMTI